MGKTDSILQLQPNCKWRDSSTSAKDKGEKVSLVNYSDKRFGGDYPESLKEIDENEFAASIFFMYSPDEITYEQLHPSKLPFTNSIKYAFAVHFYWFFDGTGFGMSSMRDSAKSKQRVRYFKVGCTHNYQSLSVKQCEEFELKNRPYEFNSVYRCKKCGHVMQPDSSG